MVSYEEGLGCQLRRSDKWPDRRHACPHKARSRLVQRYMWDKRSAERSEHGRHGVHRLTRLGSVSSLSLEHFGEGDAVFENGVDVSTIHE